MKLLILLTLCIGICLGEKCRSSVQRRAALVESLQCLGKKVGKSFRSLEDEHWADLNQRLRRCFVTEGRSACGRPSEILERDVFNQASPMWAGCDLCQKNIHFTFDKYIRSQKRSCVTQYFLDEVSQRIKGCTNRKLISFADPDVSATENFADLKRSVAFGISWRHQLDECRLGGKSAQAYRIQSCMEKTRPQCGYCAAFGSCMAENKCNENTPAVAAKACKCFFGSKDRLMASLKGIVDKVRALQKAKKVGGWDAVKDCINVVQGTLQSFKGYGRDKLEIDWLSVYAAGVKKCTGESIPAYEGNVQWACAITEQEFQGSPSVGEARTLRRALYYIANFAQAVMDRTAKFCACSQRSAAQCTAGES